MLIHFHSRASQQVHTAVRPRYCKRLFITTVCYAASGIALVPMVCASGRSFVCCDPSCNLIAGGIKLHIFSANTTKTKETPSVAMYNEATQRFVTTCGKSVREWSATTGEMISECVSPRNTPHGMSEAITACNLFCCQVPKLEQLRYHGHVL